MRHNCIQIYRIMSFKKYGGTYNTERGSTISYGTIIADRVMIRERTATAATIQANLDVKGDIICDSGLKIALDASFGTTDNNFITTYNTHVKSKLSFNNGSYNTTIKSYISGDGSQIGIGTITPQSFIDINTELTNAFAVRSTQGTIRNILTQNSATSGIAVNTSGNNSTLGFFVGDINAISPVEKSYIKYTNPNNTLTLSAGSGNVDISANTLNLKVNTTNFESQNTNFSSNMAVSNRGGLTQIYNETLTIYDNSINLYNYEQYPTSLASSGYAATFLAGNNVSNTSINLVTPNKTGVSLTGGAYMDNSSNSMAIIQLQTENDNTYIPTQMMVSNNNIDLHRSTTGINTYNPRSGSHVMDINGPVRIGNGDVILRYSNTFVVNDIMISRTDPNRIAMIGGPQSADSYVYTSNDRGKTWDREFLATYSSFRSFSLFVKYNITSMISEEGAYRNINSNIDITTNTVGLNRTFTLSSLNNTYKYVSTYMVSSNTTYGILVASTKTTTGAGVSRLHYAVQYNNTVPGSVDLSLDTASDMDGINNTVFIVGKGIQQITYVPGSAPTSVATVNTSNDYQKVYALTTDIVVASGNNIISYTTNGGSTWNDSIIISTNPSNTKSIHLYDATYGIIVCVNGVILYSIDGFITWRQVNNEIFKASGSPYLNDTSKINNMIMISKKEFLITTVEKEYSDTSDTGKSNVLYGYYPSIFEEHNNIVLDISGSINTSGSVYQF